MNPPPTHGTVVQVEGWPPVPLSRSDSLPERGIMQEDEKLVDWETFKANLRQSLDLTGEDESVDMSDQPGADKSGAD